MASEEKNQNNIINSESIFNNNKYIFANKPINRFKTKPKVEDISIKLKELRDEIEKIENCELKKNASKIVFSDGDNESKIMIVGEGPGQKEDEIGKPFVGDAGILLNKMLKSINIERKNVYITNVVNYRPPNNRKPEPTEITKYSNFLRKHISIIDPKILILMGSTAMESLFGSKIKITKLINLKQEINSIEDCKLKNNAAKLVFGDGNIQSSIMIVGEGPGQKEDEIGKPFVGDAGKLLDKMLKAINIERKNIYITNVVNYRPPNNRKPEPAEITRYSEFLREHISIINPKILILMGSTAMESLFGNKIKISKERGVWKELIINQKTYLTMITFHPAYLLRQSDQKKIFLV